MQNEKDKETMKEKIHDAAHKTKEKASEIKENIKADAEKAKEKAHEVKEDIKEKAHNVKEKVAEKIDEVKEKDKAKTIAYRTLTADIVRRLKNEGLTSEEISEYLDNK